MLEERNALPKPGIPLHLNFLKKSSQLVHKNHYVMTLTRRWVIPLMCQDHKQSELSQWKAKVEMVQDFLAVVNQLQLGLCKDRGRALFELANATLAIAKVEGCLPKALRLAVIPMLEEVQRILHLDPIESFEGKICNAAGFYIQMFNDYLKANPDATTS